MVHQSKSSRVQQILSRIRKSLGMSAPKKSRKTSRKSRKTKRKSRKVSRKVSVTCRVRSFKRVSRVSCRVKSRKATRRKSRKASRKSPKVVMSFAAPRHGSQRGSKKLRCSSKKMCRVGSRAQVMHGTAHHTAGGLTREQLMINSRGRIVSRKASAAGQAALARLHAAGYVAQKGVFQKFHKL